MVTPAGTVTEVNEVQPSNSSAGISVIPAGSVTETSPARLLNAPLPMEVTPLKSSEVTPFNLLPENAYGAIAVIPFKLNEVVISAGARYKVPPLTKPLPIEVTPSNTFSPSSAVKLPEVKGALFKLMHVPKA